VALGWCLPRKDFGAAGKMKIGCQSLWKRQLEVVPIVWEKDICGVASGRPSGEVCFYRMITASL
jgi:hypothetical protein